MNYICEDCGFSFCRIGEVKECPSCEKHHIRSITEEEKNAINSNAMFTLNKVK